MVWIAKKFLLDGGDPMPPPKAPAAPVNAPASESDAKSTAAEGKILLRFQDLGKKYDIIGKLGKPMGATIKVKGKWRDPSDVTKSSGLHFLVTQIDGKELAEPVEFPEGLVDVKLFADGHWTEWKKMQPVAGEVWEFRGHEDWHSGKTWLANVEFEIRGGMPSQAPNWDYASGISDLVGVIVE